MYEELAKSFRLRHFRAGGNPECEKKTGLKFSLIFRFYGNDEKLVKRGFCENIIYSHFLECILILLFFGITPARSGYALPPFSFPGEILEKTENEYGREAAVRLKKWEKFIIENQSKPTSKKIESVNRFVNTIAFAEDADHWLKEDYWATPYQFIASGGGDCEDYAIAKYFTLRVLGIAADQMSIAYVNVRDKKEPHMVMFYFPEAGQSPFVLDNLDKKITLLNLKSDIELIYSANENNVWVNKEGKLILVGKSSMIHKWSDVISKVFGASVGVRGFQ